MAYIDTVRHHTALLHAMAGRNGADLTLAQQFGALAPGEVRGAVHACAGCLHPGDCAHRLEAGTPGLPDYCRNADMIDEVATLLAGE